MPSIHPSTVDTYCTPKRAHSNFRARQLQLYHDPTATHGPAVSPGGEKEYLYHDTAGQKHLGLPHPFLAEIGYLQNKRS